MVYYTHGTSPVTFGALLVLYYFSIPLAVIFWYAKYVSYIKKRDFKLKKLGIYLIVAIFITSISAYELAGIYFYIHSPAEGITCYTSSCVLSSELLKRYKVNTTELERLGLPKIGPMAVYRVYDTGRDPETFLPKKMDYLVIVKPLIIVPAARVYVYHVGSGENSWKKSFTIVWPLQPGSVITENLKTEFTVIIVTGGEGSGV